MLRVWDEYECVRENFGGLALERLQEGECEALLRRHYRKKLSLWWSARAISADGFFDIITSSSLPDRNKKQTLCKIHWSHDLSNYLQFAPPNTHFKISAITDCNANFANIRKTIVSTNRKPLGHPSGLAGYRLYAFVEVMKFKSPYLNLTFECNVFVYSWHHVGFSYSVMVNIGLHFWTRTL